ncbi:DUF4340 domain-containing protein [Aquimonas voraii]|uniref:DUF4340 domain-containing protein n=1 Tax=Aquimonas voraii TaxID=265719 RepID=A0A1G6UL87_9GAMM|nr:DUF4340 domain-containing protein [Aquimonas voraii]SDD42041.1 protein of unknown function [Aquimonas voraii]
MKQKQILGLAAAAAVLMGLAVYLSESRKPAEEAPVAGPLAPGLEAGLNEVKQVVVQAAGGETITLKRGEAGWGVEEKQGYAADVGKLRELLLNLAQAQRIEPKTAVESSYPVLGVQDVDAEGASNVLLRVAGAGSEEWAVILGQNNSRGAGTFVRLKDEAQSWLVDRNLAAEKTASGWLQRDLMDIAANRITGVEVQPPEGGSVQIEANSGGEGDFRIANLPKGREPASAFVGDATAGFLSGLRIDDVRRAEGYVPAEDAQATTASFRTREGVLVAVKAHTQGGETWASFEVSLDEQAAAERIQGEQAREAMAHEQALKAAQEAARPAAAKDADTQAAGEGDSAPAEASATASTGELPEPPKAVSDPEADRAERLKALQDEVAKLQRATEGWVFKIPSFKADNLRRGMDAYLKPKA